MSWADDGTIIYKKSIKIGGMVKRIGVRGKTPSEAVKNMRKKENEVKRNTVAPGQEILAEELFQWLETNRKPALKMKSYDRIVITYKNQIKPYPLGKIKWAQVCTADIQHHLGVLVQEELSWSTIKKVYDLLHAFFTFKATHKELTDNPMTDVIMPIKDHILKPQKQMCYLTKEQVDIFTKEATRLCGNRNYPFHKYGYLFVFMIYTGVRVGELLALRWKDIDLNKKTMLINKSVEEVVNPAFDENNTELMEKKKIKRRIQKEGSTKTGAVRLIALNAKALDAIMEHKKYSSYTSPNDYVAATKTGRCNTDHNLYRRLTDILKRCELPIDQAGCHMLRHTCASLLFQAGLQVEIIASILGHSPEVCRKTYIHFCQQQQAAAIHKIAEFNI